MFYLVIFMASAVAGGLFSFVLKKWKERKRAAFYEREIQTLESVLQLEVRKVIQELSTKYPHPLSYPVKHEEIDVLLSYLEQENGINFSKLHYTYNRLQQTYFLANITPNATLTKS